MLLTSTYRRASALTIIAAACLVLSSCATVIDSAKLEKNIRTSVPKLVNVDYPVTDVSCPKDPDVVKGKDFDCDYTVEDGSECDFEDTDGDAGVVTISADDKDNLSYSAEYS